MFYILTVYWYGSLSPFPGDGLLTLQIIGEDEKEMKGKIHHSRRQSNFINYLSPEKRDRYLKEWIAANNTKELIPFIKITKHDKYYREVEYEIELPEKEINQP
jgi:hypothetical protein